MSKCNDDMIGAVSYVSFLIGLMNLEENLTQGDKQDILENLNRVTSDAIARVKDHLDRQDKKLDYIMERLK